MYYVRNIEEYKASHFVLPGKGIYYLYNYGGFVREERNYPLKIVYNVRRPSIVRILDMERLEK